MPILHPAPPAAADIRTIDLGAGQSCRLWLPAGTLVLARNGRINLTAPPRWLADQFLPVQPMLAEDDSHVLDDGGWLVLSADTPAQAVCILPPRRDWTRRLRQLCRSRPAWWRPGAPQPD